MSPHTKKLYFVVPQGWSGLETCEPSFHDYTKCLPPKYNTRRSIHDKLNALRGLLTMNILKQILIIFLFTFLGEQFQILTQIPVPGSIIGLTLLYLCLNFKIIKVDDVELVGNWLKDNLAFFFVPITVGIMAHFDILKLHWINLVIVMIVSTLITYLVTVYAANWSQK